MSGFMETQKLFLAIVRYDVDGSDKFCQSFQMVLKSGAVFLVVVGMFEQDIPSFIG